MWLSKIKFLGRTVKYPKLSFIIKGLHTPAEKFQTILTTKAIARKLSMRMSSTNVLVLKIRTSPTWERHPDNFSDESKTTKDPTKTAQYFNTSTIANTAKT